MRLPKPRPLNERIASDLGWSVEDVQSFSLPTLRELIKSPKLKAEATEAIRSGRHLIER